MCRIVCFPLVLPRATLIIGILLTLFFCTYHSEAQLDSVPRDINYAGYIGFINADCITDTLIYTHSTTGVSRPTKIIWGVAMSTSQSICVDSITYIPDSLKVSSTAIVYPTWANLQVSVAVGRMNPEDTLADMMFFMHWYPNGQDTVDTTRSFIIFGHKNLITMSTLDIASLPSLQRQPFYAKDLQIGDELMEEEPRDLTDTYSYFLKPTISLPADISLDATVILEGPFDIVNQNMFTGLQLLSLLPSGQPFTAAPHLYNGSETLDSIPDSTIVDWVLVEVRAQEAASSIIGRRAALLRFDGKIVEMDGVTALHLPMLEYTTDSCYIVVRHRNHLAIMSAVKVAPNTTGTIQYDFTGATAAYTTFMVGSIPLGMSGLYGMIGGDANGDGIINATDRVQVNNDTGYWGYYDSDGTLDSIVNAADRILTRNNTFYITQVP